MSQENNNSRVDKINYLLGLANRTRTMDEAFYIQAQISKEGFMLLTEGDRKQFKALHKKWIDTGLESLSNDEKLFMVRCWQRADEQI